MIWQSDERYGCYATMLDALKRDMSMEGYPERRWGHRTSVLDVMRRLMLNQTALARLSSHSFKHQLLYYHISRDLLSAVVPRMTIPSRCPGPDILAMLMK